MPTRIYSSDLSSIGRPDTHLHGNFEIIINFWRTRTSLENVINNISFGARDNSSGTRNDDIAIKLHNS